MACYLFQASYTSEACAAQMRNPQDCIEAIRPVIERSGGGLECAYLAFGEYDMMGIVEMLNDVRAAFSLAASAEGGLKTVKTTPPMTIEEGIEAMKRRQGRGIAHRGGDGHSDMRTPQ
jgi:uncharacterized protein with GYD domain